MFTIVAKPKHQTAAAVVAAIACVIGRNSFSTCQITVKKLLHVVVFLYLGIKFAKLKCFQNV